MFKYLTFTAAAVLGFGLTLSMATAQTADVVRDVERKLQDLRGQAELQKAEAELKKAQLYLKQLTEENERLKKATRLTEPTPVEKLKKDEFLLVKPIEKEVELRLTKPGAEKEGIELQFKVPTTPTPAKPDSNEQSRKVLEELMKSKDHKIATTAKELMGLLTRSLSPPAGLPSPKTEKPTEKPVEKKKEQPEVKVEGIVIVLDAGGETASLRMSADGKQAAVVGQDGSVTVFDVATGKEVAKFPAKK